MSGVMRFNIIPAGQPNPSPSGLYVRHEDYDQLHAANQRLETELANLKEDRKQQYAMKVKTREQRDAATAANQRLEAQSKDDQRQILELIAARERLEGEVKRLREALEHIKAMQLRGFLVLGDKANELMQAALSTANGEVTE